MSQFEKLFFLISLFKIIIVVKSDYCNIRACSNPEKHVMCLYPDKKTGDSCDSVVRSGLTINEFPVILKAHIDIRNQLASEKGVNLPRLMWDKDLGILAQRWADQCKDHNDECRSLDKYNTPVLQNVGKKSYRGSFPGKLGNEAINLTDIVNEWAELKNNPSKPINKEHQTIDRIGCGLTKTSRCAFVGTRPPTCVDYFTLYIVCNYADSSK